MWSDFVEKVVNQQTNVSDVVLRINPIFEKLPLPITQYDDPFLPFGKEIIRATQDLVIGYMFDLSSYLAMGGAGAVALERTIAYVSSDKLKILHGAFTGTGYSRMCDATGFGVDALTLARQSDLEYYLDNAPYAGFVTCEENATLNNTPKHGGCFWINSNQLSLRDKKGQVITLRVTTENILYAGKLADFAEEIRNAVKVLL